jgi:hypothetical protein
MHNLGGLKKSFTLWFWVLGCWVVGFWVVGFWQKAFEQRLGFIACVNKPRIEILGIEF